MPDQPDRYATAGAFRRALEDRLKTRALDTGMDLSRLRRLVAFDRLLARLFSDPAAPWIVKGGFAFEIRYHKESRATKDIDLAIPNAQDIRRIHEQLQSAAAREMGDFFMVAVGAPQKMFEAPPEGGARFPVEVRLAGRKFTSFHLDVGLGDVLIGQPDRIRGEEFLSFAGIDPANIAVIPIPQQFAEKIHAYTLPRQGQPNTRVKDLVDLVLLIERESPDSRRLAEAINQTFARRNIHPVPEHLPAPPASWAEPYERLAREAGLSAVGLVAAMENLSRFWDDLTTERKTMIGD